MSLLLTSSSSPTCPLPQDNHHIPRSRGAEKQMISPACLRGRGQGAPWVVGQVLAAPGIRCLLRARASAPEWGQHLGAQARGG